MKKVIFGIFAHPDDEAFGPAGTLVMEKHAGSEVHLICATAGENGTNPDAVTDLGAVRLAEWKRAGELIGADSLHNLGYADGELRNSQFLEIAEAITAIITGITSGRDDIEIEFMSLDLNGITGHLDHICMARIACYVFHTLKKTDDRVTRIRLACVTDATFPASNCDWLYMDAGRAAQEIDEVVDASEHLERIHAIMRSHHSQRGDAAAILEKLGDAVAINHFLILT